MKGIRMLGKAGEDLFIAAPRAFEIAPGLEGVPALETVADEGIRTRRALRGSR